MAVNGQEGRIVFIDLQHGALALEELAATYEPHAFLVVLAVDDLASLDMVSSLPATPLQADRLLASLRASDSMADKAIILVANKTDLVSGEALEHVRDMVTRVNGGAEVVTARWGSWWWW